MLFLFLLLLFVFIAFFIAHRVYIGSPFIYRSTRLGYLAKPFTLYKIRTLKSLPQLDHLSTCSATDPRNSKFGNLLRSSKIDEFPQLFNLISGKVTLIGPRPNVPSELHSYTFGQYSLFSTKPGITDISSIYLSNLGQIVKKYDDLGDSNQVYRSLIWPIKSYLQHLYLENRSVSLDIRLLLITLLCLVNRGYALRFLKPLLVSLKAHHAVINNLERIPKIKTISSLLLQEPELAFFYDHYPLQNDPSFLSQSTKLLIIVPVMNGQEYFLESLSSFLRFSENTSLDQCQLLYIYGQSSDATKQLLDNHLINLPNVNYITEPYPGLGIALNTNYVIRFAKADKICWLGIDDRLETTFYSIAQLIDFSDLTFFQYHHIDSDSTIIKTSSFRNVNLFFLKNLQNYISFPATVFSRSAFLSTGGMIQRHGNDLDLIIKLISFSHVPMVSQTVLSSFRIHEHSRTTNPAYRISDLRADLRVVKSHGALPVNAYFVRLCYYLYKRILSNAKATFAHWTHI